MCTAASYKTKDFYFGRTLDYEFSYGDEIVVLPREYPLRFRHCGALDRHYAIIGMAYVAGSDPLFYDGINEKGLGMAGLNFVGNAHYFKPVQGFDNVAQFEFIPWILGRCASLDEARAALQTVNLTGTPFSDALPAAHARKAAGQLAVGAKAALVLIPREAGWSFALSSETEDVRPMTKALCAAFGGKGGGPKDMTQGVLSSGTEAEIRASLKE